VECVKFGSKAAESSKPGGAAEKSGDGSSLENVSAEHLLVSGSRDRTVKVWEPLRGICLMTFAVHENWVRGVTFDPTSRFIISCSDDKSIRVFDVKEERCIRTIDDAHSHFVCCLTGSSVRPIYFTGSVDKTISLWTCNL
jgi:platelet-activating factor acetylhydrolase IB subunit alpha